MNVVMSMDRHYAVIIAGSSPEEKGKGAVLKDTYRPHVR
jgi:hypothetical protein